MMSRVQLEPTDADGVMKRKAVNLDNGAMKKSHNMALVFLCNESYINTVTEYVCYSLY